MECQRCGECCLRMLIEIDQEDIDREGQLADYCRPLRSPFTGEADGESWGYNMSHVGGCPFLDDKTCECMIYETRPKICRQFEAGGSQGRWMRGEITLEQIRDQREQGRAAGLPRNVTGL